MTTNVLDPELEEAHRLATRLVGHVSKQVLGQQTIVELAVVCLLAEGHLLIEGVPGLGKTRLARALAETVGGDFKRIQCTPDVLPTDVTGTSVFNQANLSFEFKEGPIFATVVLADEINRATPKTQSAFLEAMEELQVTESGDRHTLKRPFLVVATQNPIEFEGTYPLLEAELDRFMMRLVVTPPDIETEIDIVRSASPVHRTPEPALATPADILRAIENIREGVMASHEVIRHAVEVTAATRKGDHIRVGASPRGSIALIRAARAYACLRKRNFITIDDVNDLAQPVLAHRVLLELDAEIAQVSQEKIVTAALQRDAFANQRA